MATSAYNLGWNLSSESSDEELEIFSRKSKIAPTECIVISDSGDTSESNLQKHEVIQNKHDTIQISDAQSDCQYSDSIPVLSVRNQAKLIHKKNSSNDPYKKTAKITKSKQKKKSSLKSNEECAKLNSMSPMKNCMKYMICLIDSSVRTLCGCKNLIESLKLNSEVNFKEINSGACSVSWQRCMPSHPDSEFSPDAVSDIQNEKDMLIVVSALQFANLVNAHKASSITTDQSLSEWACELSTRHDNHRIHIVCLGMENFLHKIKVKADRQYKQIVGSNSKQSMKGITDELPDISSDDIDDALATIHIAANIDMIYAETAPDLCCVIEQLTKAVAEAPYKRLKQEDELFVNEEASVQVDTRTGKGAKKAWRQMLLLVPDIGPNMADAIVNAYPSISKLVRAYNALTTGQGELLLADVEVRWKVNITESKRRVGPVISRRIHRIFTSSDGDELVV